MRATSSSTSGLPSPSSGLRTRIVAVTLVDVTIVAVAIVAVAVVAVAVVAVATGRARRGDEHKSRSAVGADLQATTLLLPMS
eukprot:jgi/Chrpa1/18147/Chrysochromulina_OHIO_Genome00025580-RA